MCNKKKIKYLSDLYEGGAAVAVRKGTNNNNNNKCMKRQCMNVYTAIASERQRERDTERVVQKRPFHRVDAPPPPSSNEIM